MPLFKRQEPEPREASRDAVRDAQSQDTLAALRKRIDEHGLPEAAKGAALKELERVEQTDPSLPEYSIGLNYLEFVLALPWRQATSDRLDLDQAEAMLDAQHHGLHLVKDRVLEHLALTIMRQSRRFRVLVVDDEPISLENMARSLSKDGHEVLTAPDGLAALEILRQRELDLVVTDLKMSGMDGLQLLEQAHSVSPATEFILVTGYATVESAVQAMGQGAVQYLSKPLSLDLLRRTVGERARGHRRLEMHQGPILCFTGPPGTGKTSIGRSIAETLGRKFVRLAMGGMRDEAELKGHRRTYVGAMPGRILAELRRAGVNNPVFMLDEIDKVGQGFRGDPASVLLEILDPEQNAHFLDYYLDIPFNLSGIMFITTANQIEELPRPLQDRMEVIRFPSYTPGEKLHIATQHLVPRQLAAAGLGAGSVSLEPAALERIISDYTAEAGVRNLERTIGAVCRKLDRQILQDRITLPHSVDAQEVAELLGPPHYRNFRTMSAAGDTDRPGTTNDVVGVATGMVWTELGGQVIYVEAAEMPGSGKLTMTGSLGRVLRESAQTALSCLRSQSERLGLPEYCPGSRDIHLHIPAGSVPKDGPSAGVTIAAALASMLSGRPVRPEVAMTGELTLRGLVLPVSGLRDKLLAARQAGITTVILPRANADDVAGLDDEVLEGLDVVLVGQIDEALATALQPATQAEMTPPPTCSLGN